MGIDDRWICVSCRRFRPRLDTEGHDGQNLRPETLRCPACGAIGPFVPEGSPAGAAIANDLTIEAYAARLREAGYDPPGPPVPPGESGLP